MPASVTSLIMGYTSSAFIALSLRNWVCGAVIVWQTWASGPLLRSVVACSTWMYKNAAWITKLSCTSGSIVKTVLLNTPVLHFSSPVGIHIFKPNREFKYTVSKMAKLLLDQIKKVLLFLTPLDTVLFWKVVPFNGRPYIKNKVHLKKKIKTSSLSRKAHCCSYILFFKEKKRLICGRRCETTFRIYLMYVVCFVFWYKGKQLQLTSHFESKLFLHQCCGKLLFKAVVGF